MATGQPPSIPPSLQDQYAKIISPRYRIVTTNTAFQRTGFFDGARRKDPRPRRLQLAERNAEWLADRHIPDASHSARLDFINSRKVEILSGVFDATYFSQLSQIRDYTHFVEPYVNTYSGYVDPAYDDPARQQSSANYDAAITGYNTPPVGTGLPNPAPGWFGEVLLNQYGDRWLASRILSYDTTLVDWSTTPFPFYFGGSVDFIFDASFRGNKRWGVSTFSSLQSLDYTTTRYTGMLLNEGWIDSQFYWPEPPVAVTPYSWLLTRNFSFELEEIGKSYKPGGWTKMSLFCNALPPMGHYFSLNDSITCSSDFAVNAYVGKGP